MGWNLSEFQMWKFHRPSIYFTFQPYNLRKYENILNWKLFWALMLKRFYWSSLYSRIDCIMGHKVEIHLQHAFLAQVDSSRLKIPILESHGFSQHGQSPTGCSCYYKLSRATMRDFSRLNYQGPSQIMWKSYCLENSKKLKSTIFATELIMDKQQG